MNRGRFVQDATKTIIAALQACGEKRSASPHQRAPIHIEKKQAAQEPPAEDEPAAKFARRLCEMAGC